MQQAVKAAVLSVPGFDEQLRAVKAASKKLVNIDPVETPPEIATEIFKIIIKETGNTDAYRELKKKSNEKVMELMPNLEKIINDSSDSFKEAVKLSLCGNIIDYGILDDFDIEKLIEEERNAEINQDRIEKLKGMVRTAKKISFIADNAGEIGLDGLMLRELKKLNSDAEIIIFVKSIPLINDATLEDVQYFNLEKDFRIIEYPDTVGFRLKNIPVDISEIIKSSDMLISKGQANYEILHGSGLHEKIVFLLRAKCDVVAEDIGVKEGSPVILICG